MVNSIQKGKRGEREVAKMFSKWWGGEFVKAPGSGAFMTIHTRAVLASGNAVGGDLICPEDFPFSVEVKRRKIIDLYQAIRTEATDKEEDHIQTWWRQSSRDAARSNKFPLVILKEDRKQWYCLIGKEFRRHLKGNKRNYFEHKEGFVIIKASDLMDKTKEQILKTVEKIR